MTAEEAKEYVMTHLPCSMKGVVTLFDTYFNGAVKLEKLVGTNPKLMGYTTLVFYLHMPTEAVQQCHPMPLATELLNCFRAWALFHNFKIIREGWDVETFGQYVFWIRPPIEIKEDRGR